MKTEGKHLVLLPLITLDAFHWFLIAMLETNVYSLTLVISRHYLYSIPLFMLFSDKESIYYNKYYVKCLVKKTILIWKRPRATFTKKIALHKCACGFHSVWFSKTPTH